jgi:hypothetical protein
MKINLDLDKSFGKHTSVMVPLPGNSHSRLQPKRKVQDLQCLEPTIGEAGN